MAEFEQLRIRNLSLAKKMVKESVNSDNLIVNSVNNIEELQRMQNNMAKRLREWYSLYFPELDRKIQQNEEFAALAAEKDKNAILKEIEITDHMGADFGHEDVEEMQKLARTLLKLYDEEKSLTKYLESLMKANCANISAVTGSVIGAKLLRGAGSLKRLAMMRSSTIQLIGAEKALFRHIKTGARPPKHGYLLQHPLVQKSSKAFRGRVARSLADKVFVAARVDYFKGNYIGDSLLKAVEDKARLLKQ